MTTMKGDVNKFARTFLIYFFTLTLSISRNANPVGQHCTTGSFQGKGTAMTTPTTVWERTFKQIARTSRIYFLTLCSSISRNANPLGQHCTKGSFQVKGTTLFQGPATRKPRVTPSLLRWAILLQSLTPLPVDLHPGRQDWRSQQSWTGQPQLTENTDHQRHCGHVKRANHLKPGCRHHPSPGNEC